VETVDRQLRALVVTTDRGERLELSRRYLEAGNVRHGYALTGHSSQGLTVERAFVLGSGEARLQEWGYVALSRARDATRLYVTGTPQERESQFHDFDERDPVARIAQALEESAVERLAVDQRPLPAGPRHGSRVEIERAQLSESDRTRLRLLEQQRLAAVKARDVAERQLTEAQQKLDRLPRLAGGRRRDALRTEIVRAQLAINMAKDRVSQLEGYSAEAASQGPRLLEPHVRTTDRGVTTPSRGAECEVELTL
jgi:hypothetical protein